jgi:carbamoyl-phosphate synthase small subunit
VIAHDPNGVFDIETLKAEAKAWSGLVGLDLAKEATSGQSSAGRETPWVWNEGYGTLGECRCEVSRRRVDYGVKRNILRLFAGLGCKVTVVPATDFGADEVLALKPDGIFLSNGPGDPAATGEYAVPVIQNLIKTESRSSASASATRCWPCRRRQDRKDAPGPSRRQPPGQGPHHRQGRDRLDEPRFRRRYQSLPEGVEETHISLFDGSNCGLRLTGKPVFSVQHHPEASPGPQDSHYLFRRFVNLLREKKGEEAIPERA